MNEATDDIGGEVSDERVQGSAGHRVQLRAVRPYEFTRAKRQVFLNTLAATCNIRTAARAAGITAKTAHALRRRSPEFATLWAEALDIGYHYLEEQLLARAIEGVGAMGIDPDAAPIEPLPPLAGWTDADHSGTIPTVKGARPTVVGGIGPAAAGEISPAAAGGIGPAAAGGIGPAAAGGIGLAAGAGSGLLTGRGLPAAYQLALLILNQRRAAQENGPRNKRRKAMTSEEVDALLVKKLDRLDRLEAAKAARATAGGDAPGLAVGDTLLPVARRAETGENA